jgi:hypothetical protein
MAVQPPDAQELRRRVVGWRAAESEEQRLRQQEKPLSAEESLAAAEALRAINPAIFAEPDAVREREVEAARRAWDKLRERMGWRRGAPGPA